MSKSVEIPVCPCAIRYRKRALVSSAVPNPAICRIVQGCARYIVGYGPRVYGNCPGSRDRERSRRLDVLRRVDALERDAADRPKDLARLRAALGERQERELLPLAAVVGDGMRFDGGLHGAVLSCVSDCIQYLRDEGKALMQTVYSRMAMSLPRPPENRFEGIVDTLREAILTGEYRPGERLVQDDLAEALGISRIPLREALRRLEGEGLVIISPNRGAIVRPLAPKDVVDLYDVRLALESLAVRRAAGHYADLREATERMREEARAAIAGGSLPRLFHLDRDFHAGVAAASHNAHLMATLGGQWSQIMRVMHAFLKMTTYPPAVWDDHAAIVEAIAHGDGAGAAVRLERHLVSSRDAILEHLRDSYSAPA